jgi:ABC-2 type transport system permease protein
MLRTLIAKELLEQRRTSKLLIVVAVFFVMGLISPMLAKFTPQLLGSIPNMPFDLTGIIPEPTVKDAVGQYVKNISQFGVLLAILFTMGALAQEKERGTAAMLLAKPVRRSYVIISKWVAGMASILAGLLLAGLASALYTWVLFEPLPMLEFLSLNVLIAVFLGVYLTAALLASTLARTQAMAAAGAFGLLILLLILGAIPHLSDYLPGRLLGWGEGLVLGVASPAWAALAVAAGLILLALFIACLYFEREEI